MRSARSTHVQIARELGITVVAARTRYQGAMKRAEKAAAALGYPSGILDEFDPIDR